jgi:diguanylate cyclase (GGDEF)-like protein
MKFRKIIILASVMWIIVIATSFLWDYTSARNEKETIALQTARSVINLIGITNEWNDRHGGVYVPVTGKTLPSPYLEKLMRDIKVNDSLELTKVDSHYMTRQLSKIAMEKEGIEFHLTSLKPICLQNKPTEREKIFLNKVFETGLEEEGTFIYEESRPLFFYITTLKTGKPCLTCHYNQGYKEGDSRGCISVTLPFAMSIPLYSLLFGHIGIGLIGLTGIIFGGMGLSKAYETIELQAVLDSLTEIPNRRSFSETIVKEFKRSQRDVKPLAIIMCDIDNFKAYNDTYGHSHGDLCLKKVAHAIKYALKRPGDFCARYGGEEFIVILPNTGSDAAMHIAERIRINVEELGIEHNKSLPTRTVTVSLGVATSGDATTLATYEELIKYADTALYRAKDLGRNQFNLFS